MGRLVVALLSSFLLLQEAIAGVSKPSLVPRTWNGAKYGCKCYFDDSCWPSSKDWAALNKTVNGNLIVDIPPGAVCHNTFKGPLGTVKTYDAAKCADVTAHFADEQWTTDQPAAELWTYFTNETCRPTTNPSDSCTLGYYPVYVILAKTEADIKAGIDFARTNNLRLLVRNTGHDFIGRSTGWGALIINTHSFQSVAFIDSFGGPGDYSGSAVTIGAGVQGRALFKQAHAQSPPLALVIGECPTVGVAGGLVQGAGHGPMTTLHGFTADNALEFKVLTANGEYKTANADENSDLFWALKGGGPAAFAVILSATFRTYKDVKSSGIILNINGTHTNDTDLLWNGIRAFHKYSNHFVDSGLYVYFEVGPGSLHVQPFVGVGKTAAEINKIVKPLFDDLKKLGLPYSTVTKEFPTLFDLYIDMFEDEGAGTTAITGGWMFAHKDVAENNDGIIAAFQNAINKNSFLVGHLWDAGHGWPVPNSSTNPKFRNSTDFVIIALPVAVNATLAEKAAAQKLLTYDLDEQFRKAGPNGCSYVNEADPYQPNWQDHFYGTNYKQLLEVRKKWDPNGIFYAIATPGTEDWEVIEYGTRLCKKL